MVSPSRCPPWQPERPGPTRREPRRAQRSYTTRRDTICLTAACAQRSSLWVGCVVPPFIAWRPHPPVWRSPSHFPDRPVIETVFDIHRVILSNLHTFRTFAAVLSRIAAFNTPGDPMRALLSSFRIGSGHRIIRTPLASPTPRESAPCGNPFSALHPFAFATALLFVRPLS